MGNKKTTPAPTVESAAKSAARVLQADKEARVRRVNDRIAKVLEEERCTLVIAIIIRPGQYPEGKIEIVALDDVVNG